MANYLNTKLFEILAFTSCYPEFQEMLMLVINPFLTVPLICNDGNRIRVIPFFNSNNLPL